jgi:TonB family protein
MNFSRILIFLLILTGCSNVEIIHQEPLVSLFPDKCKKPTTVCEVEVEFTVNSDGTIKDDVITKSSKIKQCDQAAIRALRKRHYSKGYEDFQRQETLTGEICIQKLSATKPGLPVENLIQPVIE